MHAVPVSKLCGHLLLTLILGLIVCGEADARNCIMPAPGTLLREFRTQLQLREFEYFPALQGHPLTIRDRGVTEQSLGVQWESPRSGAGQTVLVTAVTTTGTGYKLRKVELFARGRQDPSSLDPYQARKHIRAPKRERPGGRLYLPLRTRWDHDSRVGSPRNVSSPQEGSQWIRIATVRREPAHGPILLVDAADSLQGLQLSRVSAASVADRIRRLPGRWSGRPDCAAQRCLYPCKDGPSSGAAPCILQSLPRLRGASAEGLALPWVVRLVWRLSRRDTKETSATLLSASEADRSSRICRKRARRHLGAI